VGLRLQHISRASIERTDDGWGLHVPFDIPYGRAFPLPNGRLVQLPRWGRFEDEAFLRGEAALQVASKLLPHINVSGATKRQVTSALELIDAVSEPSGMFTRYAWQPVKRRRRWSSSNALPGHALSGLAKEVRLALEMASHEEAERRALEGEAEGRRFRVLSVSPRIPRPMKMAYPATTFDGLAPRPPGDKFLSYAPPPTHRRYGSDRFRGLRHRVLAHGVSLDHLVGLERLLARRRHARHL